MKFHIIDYEKIKRLNLPHLQVHNAPLIHILQKIWNMLKYLRIICKMKATYIFYFQCIFPEINIIKVYGIIHGSLILNVLPVSVVDHEGHLIQL